MSSSALADSLRNLRGSLAAQQRHHESDEHLLIAFLSRRDDSAFAALVRRHGPMVLRVCRRVLEHEQDAEDAFQATFLVLAQNAAALRNKTRLASFLHGIAYRTAMKAKRSAERRRKYEVQTPARPPADPADELSWREVRTLLDQEIARLPEIYRVVSVLFYLEDLSREETGRRLGLKDATVARRLAEARRRLAQRLARRGVELTAVLAATSVATPPVSALPTELMAKTMKAVLASVSGKELASVVSSSVAELAQGATAAMIGSKVKIAAVLLLILATSVSFVGLWERASEPLAATTEPPAAKTESKKPAPPKPETAKTVAIQGRVFGIDGKPKADAKLLLLSNKSKITSLGVSAEDGRFTVAVPKEAMKRWDHWLIAQAGGAGIDFLDLYQFKNKKPVELRLVKDNTIRGRVVNTEGKPIRGAHVTVRKLAVCARNSLGTFLEDWKKQTPWGSEKQIWPDKPIALFSTTTDTEGRFTLPGTGAERFVTLRFSGAGIADTHVWIANRDGFDPKPYNKAFLDRIEKGHLNYRWFLLSGPHVSVVAEVEKVIRGVVTDADTGKGQPGVIVRLSRDSDEMIHFPPEAKTDAQGRYEIHGVRKTKRYLLAIDDNKDTGHMFSQVWAEDTVAHQPIRADIKIKKGVIVTGKIIDGTTGEALPGSVMAAVLQGNPFAKDYPKFDEFSILAQCDSADDTDGDRAFRVVAIPGPILLMGKTDGTERAVYKDTGRDAKYPQYFTEDGDSYLGYHRKALLQGIWNKVLEIKPGVGVVHKDIVLEREKILAEVRIQDTEGKPLGGAWARTDNPKCGVSFGPQGGRIEGSSCSVYGDAAGKPLRLVFYQAKRRLTGTLTLKGDEKQPVTVKLGPAGAIKGRLLAADGKPLADMVVELRYRDRAAEEIHDYVIQRDKEKGPILTDATGAFTFEDAIPAMAFELSFRHSKKRSEFQATTALPAIQVKPSECRDLGSIKLKPIPKKPGE